ncbi:DUF3179 domain-containing (seleno)protein [Aureibaculum luteum]|uniref:DUF3179 domain-containing (seleno)protein n=1 Tax=Aureibaculum luteum TaxID=1548456 RepID=UPI000E52F1FB|nr:DUF3179 domain-containing (seleno)protein [Aureibaculum luteum]
MLRNILNILLVIIVWSCQDNSPVSDEFEITEQEEWTINNNNITGGKGLFDLMNTPNFKSVNEISDLNDSSKVALISFKKEVRVYPYYYTNHFEIINDFFDDHYIAVSFCPLTKSAICFNRKINDKIYNLIASGYLYKDNMVPSDENLTMYWSQMLMKGIKGEFADKSLDNFNLIETHWKLVKDYFPDAKVFNHNIKNKSIFKKRAESILGNADFTYGIFNKKIDEEIELFKYENFSIGIQSVSTTLNQRSAIIIGSKSMKFFTSYYEPQNVTLSLLKEDKFPNIITDSKENIYNIFGYAVSGPDAGTQLESPKAYIAQNWAWKDFFTILNIND